MMETYALYLIKSVCWLTGFALVYILFLKDERYFELNRIYLISGILASCLLPFITVSYKVILPAIREAETENTILNVVRDTTVSVTTPAAGLDFADTLSDRDSVYTVRNNKTKQIAY